MPNINSIPIYETMKIRVQLTASTTVLEGNEL